MRFMNKPHQREPFKLQGSQNHKFDSRPKLHNKSSVNYPLKITHILKSNNSNTSQLQDFGSLQISYFVAQKILVILFSFSFEDKLKVAKLVSQFPLIRLFS